VLKGRGSRRVRDRTHTERRGQSNIRGCFMFPPTGPRPDKRWRTWMGGRADVNNGEPRPAWPPARSARASERGTRIRRNHTRVARGGGELAVTTTRIADLDREGSARHPRGRPRALSGGPGQATTKLRGCGLWEPDNQRIRTPAPAHQVGVGRGHLPHMLRFTTENPNHLRCGYRSRGSSAVHRAPIIVLRSSESHAPGCSSLLGLVYFHPKIQKNFKIFVTSNF
jgi:hypothetical protein